jgi:endonuclease-3 related protein
METYGEQNWWPAETPFEVCVGAVLTQNTAWRNVERAIENLKEHGKLSPHAILETPARELQELIKPAGFYRQKAVYLKNLSLFVLNHKGLSTLRTFGVNTLRRKLLKVKGIGPETADSIILYALDKPTFIASAYAERLFLRLGLLKDKRHTALKKLVEDALGGELKALKEFHALIVAHCKRQCRKKPRCTDCRLADLCRFSLQTAKDRVLHIEE